MQKSMTWHRCLSLALDRLVYKDEEEFLENPRIPLETRFSLVKGLNRLNHRSGYHHLFLRQLERLAAPFLPKRGATSESLKILDLGAGGGGLLKAIWHWATHKKIPVKLTGVDLSEHFVQRTQSELTSQGVEATLHQADACFLDSFEKDSFDIVVSSYVVHHLRDVGKVASFLSEVHRVARKGWLVADLDRRLYAPFFVKLAGHLFQAPSVLISDGVKSARRAWQVSEINLILEEIQKTKNLSGMTCAPFPFFPYWLIKGRKNQP